MSVDWVPVVLVVVTLLSVGVTATLVRPRLVAQTLTSHVLAGEALLSARCVDGQVAGLSRRWRAYLGAPTPEQLRLRRAQSTEPVLFLPVLGVDPAARRLTGWPAMVLSSTGDTVLRIGTPAGLVELAVPAAHVDWYRRQLARA